MLRAVLAVDVSPLMLAGGSVLVALVTGWFAYLAVRRAKSGSIETSEAKDIWEEAKAFWNARDAVQQKEIEKLSAAVATLQTKVAALEAELARAR